MTKSTWPEASAARRVASDWITVYTASVTLPRSPHQRSALIGLVALQRERAGAVGVARGVGLLPRVVVLRLRDAVLLGPAPAHDADQPELLREDRVRRREQELHRERVHLAHPGDAAQLVRALRGLRARALDREHDVVGVER